MVRPFEAGTRLDMYVNSRAETATPFLEVMQPVTFFACTVDASE